MQMQLKLGSSGAIVDLSQGGIVVGRDGRKSQPGYSSRGISAVIADSVGFWRSCSPLNVRRGEVALVSLVSIHDVLSVIRFRDVLSKARLIVGGPACINVRLLSGLISAANLGRCDRGKIDRIVDGERLDSVWTPANRDGLRVDTDAKLYRGELAVGCRRACRFCHYSWWNGGTNAHDRYDSGSAGWEDTFDSLDMTKCVRGGVTALDGFSERDRLDVGKPCSHDAIVSKLLEADAVESKSLLRLKLYQIVGYPGQSAIDASELLNAVAEADSKLRSARLCIRLHVSHFIPFPKTPMAADPFNSSVDYRVWSANKPVLFKGKRISVHSGGQYAPSVASAALATCVLRATELDAMEMGVLASKRWQASPAADKLSYLTEKMPHLLSQQASDPAAGITGPRDRRFATATR
jgi:hypothetical protein